MLGIVRPDAGQVRLGGEALFDAGAGIDVPTEDRGIAYVPQDYALFPHLTACGNVEFALMAVRAAHRRERAWALLDRLGVAACADRRPAALSAGERQRVALARALAASPGRLLFDEPFAALDAGARGEVRRFLRERLGELGLPAVLVTHDRADVEALGVPVVVLEQGRVVQRGTLAELEAHPATEYVARFCGRAADKENGISPRNDREDITAALPGRRGVRCGSEDAYFSPISAPPPPSSGVSRRGIEVEVRKWSWRVTLSRRAPSRHPREGRVLAPGLEGPGRSARRRRGLELEGHRHHQTPSPLASQPTIDRDGTPRRRRCSRPVEAIQSSVAGFTRRRGSASGAGLAGPFLQRGQQLLDARTAGVPDQPSADQPSHDASWRPSPAR
jgi:molybdate transport system ATP-binding protein